MAIQMVIDSPLSDLDIYQTGYTILAPWAPAVPGDGAARVMEEIPMLITGSSESDLQSKIRALELRLEYAKDHPETTKTFLKLKMSSGDTQYQSKIYNGRFVPDRDNLNVYWTKNRARGTVVIERDPFWEAVAAVAVEITNGNGTATAPNTINVYNCNDGTGTSPNKKNNYVAIAAGVIGGDLPAPAVLTMTVKTAQINGLLISHKVNLNVGDLIEVENFTGMADTASATCSGGNYTAATIPTSWGSLCNTGLTGASFTNTYYRFAMRFFDSPPAGTWFKVVLANDWGLKITETPATLLSTRRLQSIGTLLLPPWSVYSTSSGMMLVHLYAYNPSGGTLNMDVLYYMEQYSNVELARTDANYVLVNDSINLAYGYSEYNYATNNGPRGPQDGLFFDKVSGNGIWLVPGAAQRLYFLTRAQDLSDIANYLTVALSYRPRRRTL